VLGGNGYLRDFPAERMMRDAKVLQIYEGANEIQRLVIARQMMAKEAIGASRCGPSACPAPQRARRLLQPLARVPREHGGLARRAAAGDVRDRQRQEARVVVARGGGEHERGERPRRRAAEARPGRAQHEPTDAIGSAARELLSERAPERVPEHVDPVEPQDVEELRHDVGEAAHPQRTPGSLRQAGARRVERDELAVAGEPRERRPHVEMSADAGDQEQRRPAAVAPDAQPQPRGADVRRMPVDAVRHREGLSRGGSVVLSHDPPTLRASPAAANREARRRDPRGHRADGPTDHPDRPATGLAEAFGPTIGPTAQSRGAGPSTGGPGEERRRQPIGVRF
jgi:hypothetical protein